MMKGSSSLPGLRSGTKSTAEGGSGRRQSAKASNSGRWKRQSAFGRRQRSRVARGQFFLHLNLPNVAG